MAGGAPGPEPGFLTSAGRLTTRAALSGQRGKSLHEEPDTGGTMEGTILGYEGGEGVIKTSDGARYKFRRSDWKSPREPAAGHRVDFVPAEDRATEIYLVNPAVGAIFSTVSTLEKSETAIPTLVYACYAAAFLYGLTMIIGVVVAYSYRESASGKWYQSHYDYQIAIFWKSLIFFLLAVPLTFVYGLGMVIMLGTYIWVIVKIVKGWRCLAEGKSPV
jgi:uncharacterized membrane protein